MRVMLILRVDDLGNPRMHVVELPEVPRVGERLYFTDASMSEGSYYDLKRVARG